MVVTMMRFPASICSRSSDELVAWPTIFFTSVKLWMLSRICLSSNLLSVTTMTESKMGDCKFFPLAASTESGVTSIS